MTAWIWINLISGMVAVRFGLEKLAEERRPFYQASAWIYTCLTFSAAVMACEAFVSWRPHNWSEVLFNFSVALYFARRLWQERVKRQAENAALPETPPATVPPPRRKPAKPNRRKRRRR